MNVQAVLSGAIPQPPYILVRDESAAQMLGAALHYDWSHEPPIVVAEEWPEDFTVNAVVVTPIQVLGSDGYSSFSIENDISDNARETLNAFIRLKRMKSGGYVAYRDLVAATGFNRRRITKAVKELREQGIGVINEKGGLDINIGNWGVDANKAKAIGLEIKEY